MLVLYEFLLPTRFLHFLYDILHTLILGLIMYWFVRSALPNPR